MLSRAKAYLIHHVRLAWRYYSVERKETAKRPCKECGANPPSLADHIAPVIDPRVGFVDWNTYIGRMFDGELQPLCKVCHDNKTKTEVKERAKRRKDAKRKR